MKGPHYTCLYCEHLRHGNHNCILLGDEPIIDEKYNTPIEVCPYLNKKTENNAICKTYME